MKTERLARVLGLCRVASFSFALAASGFAADSPEVLFADDFSKPEANGHPNLDIWGSAPRNEAPPAQSIRVLDTDAKTFFGESGPYLRLFADGSNSDSIWLTANRRFSRPAEVVTVVFDFYLPGGGDNGPRLRLGDLDSIFNANRVRQDIQFLSSGGLAGAPGIFQTGTKHRIRIIYNNSAGEIEEYVTGVTLESDAYDVWVDGERVLANHRSNTFADGLAVGEGMRSLSIGAFGSDANELLIRNLVVYEGVVPEESVKPPPDDGDPLRYFLSPEGSDDNDGLSPEDPVLTLGRVQQLLHAVPWERNVEVLIGPGIYYGQTVVWTRTHPVYSIVFQPVAPDAAMPVFDGGVPDGEGGFDYPGGTWFRLQHSAGQRTNLEFRRLRVQNYQDAISFNGNRNNPAAYNSHNRIRECSFYRIGNLFNPQLQPSTAVIRFVNSQENIVENNDFVDVVNATSGGLIHATYVAHLSDSNRIFRNRFINHSGDPIRVRDFSNFNDVRDNIFIRAGTGGGYTEWYCDHDARDDCTKPDPECPSWENEFRGNYLVSNYTGGFLPVFRFFQGDSTTGCWPLFEGAVRLYTSGNTRPEGFSPYELWRHRYFAPGEREDESVAGPGANPAGDGLRNIVKFALGLDPRRPAPRELRPAIRRADDGRPALLYPVDPDAEGAEIVVETSGDLTNWQSGPIWFEAAESFVEKGRKWRKVRLTESAASESVRFIRLSVRIE